MPKLNEQRIVKRRTIFPFNHEKGTVGWFSNYYVLEEWYKPCNPGYWGWHPVGIVEEVDYKAYKRTGEVRTCRYSRL